MLVPFLVDFVDDGRERCRFAGTGWPGDQDHPSRFLTKLSKNRRQPQLVKCLDLVWNRAKDRANGTTLVKYIGAKAGQTFDAKAEIQFEVLFKAMLLRVGE